MVLAALGKPQPATGADMLQGESDVQVPADRCPRA